MKTAIRVDKSKLVLGYFGIMVLSVGAILIVLTAFPLFDLDHQSMLMLTLIASFVITTVLYRHALSGLIFHKGELVTVDDNLLSSVYSRSIPVRSIVSVDVASIDNKKLNSLAIELQLSDGTSKNVPLRGGRMDDLRPFARHLASVIDKPAQN